MAVDVGTMLANLEAVESVPLMAVPHSEHFFIPHEGGRTCDSKLKSKQAVVQAWIRTAEQKLKKGNAPMKIESHVKAGEGVGIDPNG